MKTDEMTKDVVGMPSRRQFINTAALVTGGAAIACLALLDGCKIIDSLTESQSVNPTIPTKISRIENMPEVTSVLRTEKEQFSSFSNDLKQFQLDMNELDAILAQSSRAQDTWSDLSEERSLKLQILMEKRAQMESTLSNILKAFENTQKDLVANLK